MPAHPLLVVQILFLLSLAAAIILFKFFKAIAVIKTGKYRAGGAIAGFIIVYGMLYASYNQILLPSGKVQRYESQINQLSQEKQKYQKFTANQAIYGTVSPRLEYTKVVLAVADTDVDTNANFKLSAPCVDLKEGHYSLYVITHDKAYRPYSYLNLLPSDDLSAVKVDVPVN